MPKRMGTFVKNEITPTSRVFDPTFHSTCPVESRIKNSGSWCNFIFYKCPHSFRHRVLPDCCRALNSCIGKRRTFRGVSCLFSKLCLGSPCISVSVKGRDSSPEWGRYLPHSVGHRISCKGK